jgi:hypothetical protein
VRKDVLIMRFEFGVTISMWFCYNLDVVWVWVILYMWFWHGLGTEPHQNHKWNHIKIITAKPGYKQMITTNHIWFKSKS